MTECVRIVLSTALETLQYHMKNIIPLNVNIQDKFNMGYIYSLLQYPSVTV